MVSRCLSATGVRFSVILFPPGIKVLTVGLPNHRLGPRRGFRVPHARAATGVGALCSPGTTVLIPDRGHYPPAPAASQRPVPPPRKPSHRRGSCLTRHQPRVHTCSPVQSSPRLWPPGWNGPPLGFPPSFAPRRPGAERRTSGREQAIEHGPGTTRSTSHQSISNPVVHS